MALRPRVRLAVFLLSFLGLALYALLHPVAPAGPIVLLEGPRTFRLTLAELRRLPSLQREGVYQNRYGNWRDRGVYTGVPLPTLITTYFGDIEVSEVTVVGKDGYRVRLSRDRLYDPAYPVVLAYALDGVEPPAWEDGPRIVVLPEDGDVSNAEYRADSAGAFWVKRVAHILISCQGP